MSAGSSRSTRWACPCSSTETPMGLAAPAVQAKAIASGPRARRSLWWPAAIALCAMLAALNLLAGASGGLARLGLPVPGAALASHGAVMACGFFGTLIALERAVALRRLAGLIAPLAAGFGGLLAWMLHATAAAQGAWGLAAGALVALYLTAGMTRAWSLPLAIELAAALCWAAGTAAWVGGGLAAAVPGWMAFLVLTIAAERRELTQMVRLPAFARQMFLVIVALALSAVALGLAEIAGIASPGRWPAGLWWASCVALALWLLRWDIAPRKWRSPGWLGHTAQCLSVGYGWLLAGALLGLAGLAWPGGAAPLALHAVLLGFVFAMVFGHAPIILPALAKVRPVYSAWARWPIWILSVSLAVRGLALASGSAKAMAVAGAGHALAIVWFAAVMITSVARGRHGPAARR